MKTFGGTSADALHIQIWTALVALLILKYLQLRATFGWSLSTLVALLRRNLFASRDVWTWLNDPFTSRPNRRSPRQSGVLPALACSTRLGDSYGNILRIGFRQHLFFWKYVGENPFGHSGRRISGFYGGLVGDFRSTQKWEPLRRTNHDRHPVRAALGNAEALIRILDGER